MKLAIIAAGLLAAATPVAAQQPSAPAPEGPARTIVAVATEAGTFKTLLAALAAADLAETLNGAGPFTVFAPTDEAFAKLPAGTVEALLKDVPRLKQVLLLHVVPGKVAAREVVTRKGIKTLQGQSLPINAKHGVKVGAAKVVKADVHASNGVIHVIDTVLLPK